MLYFPPRWMQTVVMDELLPQIASNALNDGYKWTWYKITYWQGKSILFIKCWYLRQIETIPFVPIYNCMYFLNWITVKMPTLQAVAPMLHLQIGTPVVACAGTFNLFWGQRVVFHVLRATFLMSIFNKPTIPQLSPGTNLIYWNQKSKRYNCVSNNFWKTQTMNFCYKWVFHWLYGNRRFIGNRRSHLSNPI